VMMFVFRRHVTPSETIYVYSFSG